MTRSELVILGCTLCITAIIGIGWIRDATAAPKQQLLTVSQGLGLTEPQKQEVARLMKLYRDQLSAHCTLCNLTKRQNYVDESTREYVIKLQESAKKVELVINQIIAFYRAVGIEPGLVQKLQDEMRQPVFDLFNLANAPK